MTDKIVSIVDGAEITVPGTPRPELIAFCERLAEMARSGELDGIACALLLRTDATDWEARGRITRGLIGALQCVNLELCHGDVKGD